MIGKPIIIFDFDGTIADTYPFVFKIVNKLSQELGRKEITKTDLKKAKSMTPVEIIKHFRIPLVKIPYLIFESKKILSKEISKIDFIEGMRDVVDKLKKGGFRLGILTSNSKENVDLFLKTRKAEKLFEFIHSEKNIFGKHRSLEKIIRERKLNKKNIFYVGDEIRDIEACKKIGVKIISVSWGYNTKELLEKHKPDILIDSPKLFSSIFDRLMAAFPELPDNQKLQDNQPDLG